MNLEDFYQEVGDKLNLIAAEEPLESGDRKVIADKYLGVHAEYSRRDLFPWFDDEDVPDWAADAVATIVASRLVTKFSVSQLRREQLLGVDLPEARDVIIGDGQNRNFDSEPVEYY